MGGQGSGRKARTEQTPMDAVQTRVVLNGAYRQLQRVERLGMFDGDDARDNDYYRDVVRRALALLGEVVR